MYSNTLSQNIFLCVLYWYTYFHYYMLVLLACFLCLFLNTHILTISDYGHPETDPIHDRLQLLDVRHMFLLLSFCCDFYIKFTFTYLQLHKPFLLILTLILCSFKCHDSAVNPRETAQQLCTLATDLMTIMSWWQKQHIALQNTIKTLRTELHKTKTELTEAEGSVELLTATKDICKDGKSFSFLCFISLQFLFTTLSVSKETILPLFFYRPT